MNRDTDWRRVDADDERKYDEHVRMTERVDAAYDALSPADVDILLGGDDSCEGSPLRKYASEWLWRCAQVGNPDVRRLLREALRERIEAGNWED